MPLPSGFVFACELNWMPIVSECLMSASPIFNDSPSTTRAGGGNPKAEKIVGI
ncbi:hypothetical protein LMG28140_02743 [Paraburkholderia metrosideri]|uniref:Uncharacterized protein n=1 Tax=Paraburkholderia metrosideri TaxID=580937 RepID=A0ABN7HUU9_9BURK|nr:hypothetical protein LMG28140_02743 [Paraburkholderia metrosideri]